MEAFAIFCGMGIHNTHMYEKAIIAMAKQSVTFEVLSYHASASIEDAKRLRVSGLLLSILKQFIRLNQWFQFNFLETENSVGSIFSFARFLIWWHLHGWRWYTEGIYCINQLPIEIRKTRKNLCRRAFEYSWNLISLKDFTSNTKCCAGGCWAWRKITVMLLTIIGVMHLMLRKWCSQF